MDKTPHPSRSLRHMLLILLAAVALLASCRPSATSPQQNAEERIHRLRGESRLVLMQYTLKELCGSRDETLLRLLGDKEVLYRLTAHVTAGIDMRRIRPDALAVGADSTAVLTLPHSEVFGIDIPEQEIENVYERVTGISRSFTADERNRVKRAGEREVERTIARLDICARADRQAELFFRSLLVQAGFIPAKCVIRFK